MTTKEKKVKVAKIIELENDKARKKLIPLQDTDGEGRSREYIKGWDAYMSGMVDKIFEYLEIK